MSGNYLAVGVKLPVGIRQDRERRVSRRGLGAFWDLDPSGLTGPGGDEHRVGEQFGPTVRVRTQFGGPAQPLRADRKSASSDGQLRGPGQNLGHVLVGFKGCCGQMRGAADQHLVIESGEVSVGVAAFLGISLMNHRRSNQWMPKDDVPQRIDHQEARLDCGCDVAHHKPGPRR